MVLGVNAPRVILLKESIKNKCKFEVFPNLVINITSDTKLSQQIHYIINQNKFGIFHLGSTDLVHHSDLFLEIAEKLGGNLPIFTNTFTSNEDHFLAVLPKENKLPLQHQITVNEVIKEITCNESLITLKEKLI
jgi:dTDP-4-dehydrorhamnose reductase